MLYKVIYLALLSVFVLSGCSEAEKHTTNSDIPLSTEREVSTVVDSQENISSFEEFWKNTSSKNTDISEEETKTGNTESTIDKKENPSVNNSTVTKTEDKGNGLNIKDDAQKVHEHSGIGTDIDPTEKQEQPEIQRPNIERPEFSVQVANRIEELLNKERQSIGIQKRTLLSGLSKIAVYRSQQIVEQFSHNWVDANGKSWQAADYAAAQFKYGKHIVINETRFDVTTGTVVDTGNIIETYSYGGTENIAKGGIYENNVQVLAEYIVSVFKSSSNHWSSLMSEDKVYDGIGVTIIGSNWYCSVNSSAINYG